MLKLLNCLKNYRDLKGFLDTAFEEGKIEGETKKGFATAKLMKADGEPLEKIMRYTGLSENDINNL
jgi:hypothetical protein